ncbi:hypothetical protein [Sphingobacterium lactis]|uniref:hypothetical protein n=1 Tax=Sphingobacterium lactis TaxID=797291 RepID=UPI003DA67499
MKAEELRIGNFIQFNNKVEMIDSITTKGTWIGSEGVLWNDIQPIPLSEEVLLKSNFIAYANVYAYELRDLDLSIDVNFTKSGGYIVSVSDEKSDFSRVLSTTMKLHELQNLIGSFGEEMEVKWS